MIVTIKYFPKDWLKHLYKAIEQDENRCQLISEDHARGDMFCELTMEIPDIGQLIFLGAWIGHNQLEEGYDIAMPQVFQNVQNLLIKATEPSKN